MGWWYMPHLQLGKQLLFCVARSGGSSRHLQRASGRSQEYSLLTSVASPVINEHGTDERGDESTDEEPRFHRNSHRTRCSGLQE